MARWARLAQLGWLFVGVYFFAGACGTTKPKGDLILTIMSVSALPLTLGIGGAKIVGDIKARKALD